MVDGAGGNSNSLRRSPRLGHTAHPDRRLVHPSQGAHLRSHHPLRQHDCVYILDLSHVRTLEVSDRPRGGERDSTEDYDEHRPSEAD